jgi:predicted CXXCH cytochrome family protein
MSPAYAPGRGLVVAALFLLVAGAVDSAVAQSPVALTRHNMSASGRGTVRATVESQVCVFCHTPHRVASQAAPGWNRRQSATHYTPYGSGSLQANVGQPNGASKLCLSCHDGTIALGQVLNLRGMRPATIALQGTNTGGQFPAGSPPVIGTVLVNDHPISFTFDQALKSADGELVDPASLRSGPVRLSPGTDPDVADAVQCTSCHDAHDEGAGKFLRKQTKGQVDNLCLTCHRKTGWRDSSHESSAVDWPAGQSIEKVRDHSCVACHAAHTVAGAEQLLVNGAVGGVTAIEETCYMCHQASGAGGVAQDIRSQFIKTRRHVMTSNPGAHKPVGITRPPAGLPENVLLSPGSPAEDPTYTDQAHVECVDCHNPHRVTRSNRAEGVRGVALNGTIIENVVNDSVPVDGQPSSMQYPVCLRCHGDTFDRVIGTGTLPSGATPSNKRLEIQTTNSSFHPVAGPGRNNSGNLDAQLAASGLSVNSVIKCTDCHNNNAYENTTGRVPPYGTTPANPVGPHGSTYGSLLRANYWSTLPGPTSWSPANFNLCFRCHDQNRLMAPTGASTGFSDGSQNLHELHIADAGVIGASRMACSSCHYNIHSNEQPPNTVYTIDGVATTNPPSNRITGLINFHPSVTSCCGRSRPEWEYDTSLRRRRCYLTCHTANGQPGSGAVMNGSEYIPDAAGDWRN